MNQTAQEKLRIAQKYLARKKDIDKAQFLSDALFGGGTLTVLGCTLLPVLAMGFTGMVFLLLEIPFLYLNHIALGNRNRLIERSINDQGSQYKMRAKDFLKMLRSGELKPYIQQAKKMNTTQKVVITTLEDTQDTPSSASSNTDNKDSFKTMKQYFEDIKESISTEEVDSTEDISMKE